MCFINKICVVFLIFFSFSIDWSSGFRTPILDGKIVGGQQVNITKYPHQVSVRVNDQHFCGGSIINKNTVLTAGHCVHGMNHKYSVRVGNTNHNKGTSYTVSKVILHKNYNSITIDNDMAILKLKNSLTFSESVKPIDLQPKGSEVLNGTIAWVSGWGVIYEGSSVVPTNLRAVNVAVISNKNCSSIYRPVNISSHMLCAQTIGHDSCQGDSGGPLVANNKLIGVVSWGYGCARPGFPGVYAKVSDMHDWIVKNNTAGLNTLKLFYLLTLIIIFNKILN